MNEHERLLMEYRFPSAKGREQNYIQLFYLENSDDIRIVTFYQGGDTDQRIGKLYLYVYDLTNSHQEFLKVWVKDYSF